MKKFFLTLLVIASSASGDAGAQERNTFTDARDGRLYKCVTVGGQTWMAENLAWLPEVNRISDAQFDYERYWVYGYYGTDVKEARHAPGFKTYGVLYNNLAARNGCPEGWHLPADNEWAELETALGMLPDEARKWLWRGSGSVGRKLMAASGWHENNGTGESGFDALPGGLRGLNGFEAEGYGAYFWTASPTNGDNAVRRNLLFDDPGVQRTEDRRYIGYSVRCVKNQS